MRIQHWSKLTWGLALTLSATLAWAQPPAEVVDPGSPLELAQELEEGPVVPQMIPGVDPGGEMGGYADPQMQGYGGYADPNMLPWPAISPYDHAFDQTVNEDGLWRQFVNDNRKKHFANLQYLALWYRKPGGGGNDPTSKQIGFPITLNPVTQGQVYRLDAIEDPLFSNGFQGQYGWINPDDTGMEISAFFGGNPDEEIAFPQQVFLRSVYLNRVRLADGARSSDPIIFDRGMIATYGAHAYGAEGNAITTPLLGRGGNKIQALYGLRYMGVHERLSIAGNDSQLKWTFVDIAVDTQLIGPQAGFRWTIGGEALKIRSFFNAGALANFDVKKIRYTNYGTINDPTPTKNGNLKERHSHVSPMIELGVQGESPLFSYIPYVNRIPLVREGVFQVGYKWTNVFLFDRPANSITWGDPVPEFDTERESWSLQSLNLGIQWNW